MDDATQKLVDEWERVVSAESLRRADALIRVVGAGGRMRDALEAAQRESSGLREKLEISMAVGAKDAAERDALEAAQRPPVELAMSPEDIAAEYAPFDGSDPDTVIHVRGLIAAAIREDRAQRPPVSPEVREAQAIVQRLRDLVHEADEPGSDGWACRREADALLARFSFPTLDVEKVARWLCEHHDPCVTEGGCDFASDYGRFAAAALVAALRSGELTREETNE